MSEAQRIQQAYSRRDASGASARYGLATPYNLYALQQQERMTLRMLREYGLFPLADKKILDVGCGDGRALQRFVDYGAEPANLCGLDLLPDRIQRGERLNPGLRLLRHNAQTLPFPDASFDLVVQGTVFTSMLDPAMRRQVAGEMLRVLRPGGAILWYDYHLNNPRNPDVRGVKKAEIRRLFPGCAIHLRRVTLAPPLARRTVLISWIGSLLLEKLPFLCAHYLGVFIKREA